MKERPILFGGDMVRAILDGRKTQTRRPVKLDFSGRVRRARRSWHLEDPNAVNACPFGAPGDRLWVRETWACPQTVTYYRADEEALLPRGEKWTPSIHMPRWASRIALEVTAVRVERVQDITEKDALAEGTIPLDRSTPREMFAEVWQSIYANWPTNPWVWVVEFRRIQP